MFIRRDKEKSFGFLKNESTRICLVTPKTDESCVFIL